MAEGLSPDLDALMQNEHFLQGAGIAWGTYKFGTQSKAPAAGPLGGQQTAAEASPSTTPPTPPTPEPEQAASQQVYLLQPGETIGIPYHRECEMDVQPNGVTVTGTLAVLTSVFQENDKLRAGNQMIVVDVQRGPMWMWQDFEQDLGQECSPSTVIRELGSLTAIYDQARIGEGSDSGKMASFFSPGITTYIKANEKLELSSSSSIAGETETECAYHILGRLAFHAGGIESPSDQPDLDLLTIGLPQADASASKVQSLEFRGIQIEAHTILPAGAFKEEVLGAISALMKQEVEIIASGGMHHSSPHLPATYEEPALEDGDAVTHHTSSLFGGRVTSHQTSPPRGRAGRARRASFGYSRAALDDEDDIEDLGIGSEDDNVTAGIRRAIAAN